MAAAPVSGGSQAWVARTAAAEMTGMTDPADDGKEEMEAEGKGGDGGVVVGGAWEDLVRDGVLGRV
jgi:hypothetical protein